MSILSFSDFHASVTTPLASVSMKALPIFGQVTNSVFVSFLVTALILFFVRRAMGKRALIPDAKQNLVEVLVESLYNLVESIVGKKVAPRAFPLLGTIFVFVLVSNWFGLLPGVGTIGLGEKVGFLTVAEEGHGGSAAATPAHEAPSAAVPGHAATDNHAEASEHGGEHKHFIPLLRPATADFNFTLALSAVFMIVWFYLTMREVGPWGFIVHTFGPKGGLKGIMGIFVAVIFFAVGLIELVSIGSRPVSLSFRLFGNIFAGENLLHAMSGLGALFHASPAVDFLMRILLPVPFYFMEILVGFLQATVFMLLCAVYIQLSTAHDDHGDEHGDEGHAHH